MENLMGMLGGLFKGGSQGGSLIDLLSKKSMGGASSAMSGPIAGAVLPQNSLNQALTGSPTAKNPMMSPREGASSESPSSGSKGSGFDWQQYMKPQDTSAGLSAGYSNDPMYNQMMQQSMQGQQNQQQPKQVMTPTAMPQMPGAVHPNATWASLLQMLSGGG
jgi:hypothetical protein